MIWLRIPRGGNWDEAEVVLYAEMIGIGKPENLNDMFNDFTLGIEP